MSKKNSPKGKKPQHVKPAALKKDAKKAVAAPKKADMTAKSAVKSAKAPVKPEKDSAKLDPKKLALKKPLTKEAAPKLAAKTDAKGMAQPAGKKKGDKAKDKKSKNGEMDMEADTLLETDADFDSGEDLSDLEDLDLDATEPEAEETEVVEVESPSVLSEAPKIADEVFLTDAEGRRYCRVRDCDQVASVDTYCRYHYLLLWKKIQVRRKILIDGKLERYVEELTARYPDKFLELIRKDLRSEKDFLGAIAELEIDESANEAEFEDESQNFIDEVRGIGPETSMSSDDDEF